MTPSAIVVKLSEVAEINPRQTNNLSSDATVSFVSMAGIDAEAARVKSAETRRYGDVNKGYTPFRRGDVLLAKITPCFENGKIAQADIPHEVGFGSTEFHVIRPSIDVIDGRYLLHLLRQDAIRRAGERRMNGSGGQRRVPAAFLSELEIRLPSLPEQRRMADVLDRAETLRAKRRAGLDKLSDLLHAIFVKMFGDPLQDAARWPTVALERILTRPLRNGLSPSHSGKVRAKVLTLSAVTGSEFDSTACKVGTFQTVPPPSQAVDASDLLICRGNGNLALVGKGYFPPAPMPEVTFPDTIIAARINRELAIPEFLEHAWNGRAVRQQIEALARTTNGTYKVNQTMLEGVQLMAPPIALQNVFAAHVALVRRQRELHHASLSELDSLFLSLQNSAFQGLSS